MPKVVNVVLVRHGETVDNAKRLMQGQKDSLLSELGRQQAEILGHSLADEVFTRIFSSDLIRAFETCSIVRNLSRASPPTIVKDVRLRERLCGVFEGLHISVLFEEAKRLGMRLVDVNPEGAETQEELGRRVMDFFKVLFDICDEGEESEADENVLVVSHGGSLRSFLLHITANQELFTVSNLDLSRVPEVSGNTGVTRIQIGPISENGTRSITFSSFNDISHLRRAADEQKKNLNGETVTANDGV